MNELLSNPKAWLILGCLGAMVLGLNLSLLGLLRRDKAVMEEASKWSKALRGGREGQQRQDAQLDELHRLVSNLQSPTDNTEKSAPSDSEE